MNMYEPASTLPNNLQSETNPSNWYEVLEGQAHVRPDAPSFVFLDSNGVEERTASFGDLSQQAKAVAQRLTQEQIAGGNVILFYPQGITFVESFFGIIYAGLTPIPAFAPNAHRDNSRRLEGIVQDSEAKFILTDTASLPLLEEWAETSDIIKGLTFINTDEVDSQDHADWTAPQIDADLPCFLQYTSGSTGTPKGVMVTHNNLIENMQVLSGFYKVDDKSTFISWVPLYHDLGLIGNMLFAIYSGSRCVMMAPETFIRQPLVWLKAISTYKADISFAPTFAFQLSTKFAAQLSPEEYPLDHWRVAVIGAEPIFKSTMEAFAAAYADHGFTLDRFMCAYGLAESTLMIVSTPTEQAPKFLELDTQELELGNVHIVPPSEEPGKTRAAVSSGFIAPGHDMRIVDPKVNKVLPEGRVGEIFLAGPSITKGYYLQEEASEKEFRNHLNGGDPDRLYLRTGDTGFMLDGELYVTGRTKDVIIINGRNHYPQDIEMTTYQADSRLRPGCVVAFPITEDEQEKLAVIAEVRPNKLDQLDDQVFQNIYAAIQDNHGLSVSEIALVKAGRVAKTSSGKLQRRLMKARLQGGKLDILRHFSAAGAETKAEAAAPNQDKAIKSLTNWIRFVIADSIGKDIEDIKPQSHVMQLGIDSVKVVEILMQVGEKLNIPPQDLKPWTFDSLDLWITHLNETRKD